MVKSISELFDISGKTAVVTGASSGLGQRMARVFHGAGATVVIGARRLEKLEELASELGERIIPVACDVGNDADCEMLISAANDTGSLDILVNSAGTCDVGPAEHQSTSQFRHVIDINLNATFVLAKLAAQTMLEKGGGSIINISSALGIVASSPIAQAGYCASKGGLLNLTRELAAQWASRGVRVNAIAPGWFLSEMTDDMFADKRGMAFIERGCPIGRAGDPDELDGALLFLASSASSYVIGQTISVDGGWTIR